MKPVPRMVFKMVDISLSVKSDFTPKCFIVVSLFGRFALAFYSGDAYVNAVR